MEKKFISIVAYLHNAEKYIVNFWILLLGYAKATMRN